MSRIYEKSVYRRIVGNARRSCAEILKMPKFFCQTCLRFKENRCTLFNRHVIEDYNKCFYHTNYMPVSARIFGADKYER